MPSIFTKIANREIPGYFVAEDDEFFAILDILPLVKGHVLVIPKFEVDYIFDLDSEHIGRFFQFSQRVARSIEKSVDCLRVGVAVIGLEVPHAHIHLVPLNSMSDINFSKSKLQLSSDELGAIAADISKNFI